MGVQGSAKLSMGKHTICLKDTSKDTIFAAQKGGGGGGLLFSPADAHDKGPFNLINYKKEAPS